MLQPASMPVRVLVSTVAVALAVNARAASGEADLSRLPPPASKQVDFTADIMPILEKSCFRCHGPERPRSGFRLDNRESALKGGNQGTAIAPGDSTKSALIIYVARLDPEMAMPPEGKGDPLTPEQVGLLRAWIDQGAQWGVATLAPQTTLSLSPMVRWVGVAGDENKFREVEGIKEGWAGGLEYFSLTEQIGPDKKFLAEGRVLLDELDVKLKLAVEKTDLGFARAGFEQWRRYYDDTGGYFGPTAVLSWSLDQDLHMDFGRAWVDFGLVRPHWPRMVLGYEYQFNEGTKSTLEWGPVLNSFGGTNNIYPASKGIEEHTHVFKLDLSLELAGWNIEDNARAEMTELKTHRIDAAYVTIGPRPVTTESIHQQDQQVQGMNTIRLEKQVRDWWLTSGGYFFSTFDGESRYDLTTLGANDQPATGPFWNTDNITLRRDSHVFSLSSLFLPVDSLSASVSFQSEWTHQEGFGNVNLDSGDPNTPDPSFLKPASVSSDLDKAKTMENAGLRYTRIPYTVLFAEARFEQEDIGQYEQELASQAADTFMRNTDASNDRYDLRAGFSASPWRRVSLNADYRQRLSDSDYDDRLDVTLDPLTGSPISNEGYSAFIRHRKIQADEVQVKLVLRPLTWLKTTFTYQCVSSDYRNESDPVPGGVSPGGGITSGPYDANVLSANLTCTPWQRFYFSGALTYRETRTATAQNGDPSVVPYQGDVYVVTTTANYAVNHTTGLRMGYSYSQADYSQNNEADGLPLGVNYTRHGLTAGLTKKLSEAVSTNLRYGFYKYSEPSSGGVNDYTAHGVFVTLAYKWR